VRLAIHRELHNPSALVASLDGAFEFVGGRLGITQ
jgi:hypothetical protein